MTVLVLGDLILDEYLTGISDRLSPEAPVPVILNAQKKYHAGGAANVALNLHAMGTDTDFISQAHSSFNTELIAELNYKLLPCNSTPTKTRILANNQIICRLDTEQYQLVNVSDFWFDTCPSICVLSDYNKGFLHNSQKIIDLCRSRNIRTIVDPKKSWSNYQGCWLLKANLKELADELGYTVDITELADICTEYSNKYQIENLVITLGSQGMFAWSKTAHKLIPSLNDFVVDVTGAGDVVVAALAHYTDQGLDLIAAAERANKLAGISVTHPGCYIIAQKDLNTIEEKIVFTNGCFDILHRGHVEYLRKSKSFGTKLVVGLNSDRSVRNLKGPNRPINTEQDRKAMLESLEFVDEVVIFDQDTPRELILQIKPDIITKGGDYSVDKVVGNDLVNQVIIIPIVQGYSTTGLLEKL